MAVDFRRLRYESPEEKRIRECTLRKRLAEMCLHQAQSNAENANECLYDALSHLACIPECEINISLYDDLHYQYNLPFDKNACILVKEKLMFLEGFIAKLIIEKGVGNYE